VTSKKAIKRKRIGERGRTQCRLLNKHPSGAMQKLHVYWLIYSSDISSDIFRNNTVLTEKFSTSPKVSCKFCIDYLVDVP